MSGVAAAAGWRATLELHLRSLDGRTVIAQHRHSGPLLVQRAFYPESATARSENAGMGEPAHVYLLHPPGGIASGDSVELCATVHRGAHVLLTAPAAGKFYRRAAARTARLQQTLWADGGILEWLPQENIFYPHAAAELSTVVHLRPGSRFIGWEIGCFGLPANGLSLDSGEVGQRFELWLEERPVLLENLAIGRSALAARWGLAGHCSSGTWLGYPAGAEDVQTARALALEVSAPRAAMPPGCAALTVACTLVDGVLVCRALASRADQLKQVFVALWRALRPALTGRDAVPPRVWAT